MSILSSNSTALSENGALMANNPLHYPSYEFQSSIFCQSPSTHSLSKRFVSALRKEMIHLYPNHTVVSYHYLSNLFALMTIDNHISIKLIIRKEQGYFRRLFSNESWEEWLEDRTALGKIISAFFHYLDNSHQHPKKFIDSLTPEIIINANEQIVRLFKQIRETTYCLHEEEASSKWEQLKLLGKAVSSWLSFPPGAQAISFTQNVQDHAGTTCTIAKVFINVQKQSTQQNNYLTIEGHADSDNMNPPFFNVNNDNSEDDSTPENDKKYLETALPGTFIPDFEPCKAVNSIEQIKNIKQPGLEQMLNLEKAYKELQLLANEDDLALCNQRLMELLDELSLNSDAYFVDALRPLPAVLMAVLNNSGGRYTSRDLSLQATKINEVSRKMIAALQSTNEQTALGQWIDVMLLSAAKTSQNTNLVSSTFETMLPLLQSGIPGIVQHTQEKKLRRMVQLQTGGLSTLEQQAVMNKILEITGPQTYVGSLLHFFLENIPDEIQKLDQIFQDIRLAVYQSATLQQLTKLVQELVMLISGIILLIPKASRMVKLISIFILGRITYSYVQSMSSTHT